MVRKNIFSSILLSALILFLAISPVFAEEVEIIFSGQNKSFTVNANSEFLDTDLFSNYKDVMPGDLLKQTVTVENVSKDSDYISLYLTAVEHNEENNPLHPAVAEKEADVEQMKEFLSHLNLKVSTKEKIIFDGSPVTGTESIKLGDLNPDESIELIAELTVPVDLANEHSDRLGEIDWKFTAEGKDRSSTDTNNSIKPNHPGSNENAGGTTGITFWLILLLLTILLCYSIWRKFRSQGKQS